MIRLENVAKTLSPRFTLAPLSLDFENGTTSVLIGPSGCGKSTVLRLLAGLVAPDSGSVKFGEEVLQAGNAQDLRLSMGYVIQEGGLFPHLSVEANVALAARFLKRNEADVAYSIRGALAEELRRTQGLTLKPAYPPGTFWLNFVDPATSRNRTVTCLRDCWASTEMD